MYNGKPTYVQEDLVQAKNRLHKVLQVTFPKLENLLCTPTGEQYYNLIMAFPGKDFVLSLSQLNCESLSVNLFPNTSLKNVLLIWLTNLLNLLNTLIVRSRIALFF